MWCGGRRHLTDEYEVIMVEFDNIHVPVLQAQTLLLSWDDTKRSNLQDTCEIRGKYHYCHLDKAATQYLNIFVQDHSKASIDFDRLEKCGPPLGQISSARHKYISQRQIYLQGTTEQEYSAEVALLLQMLNAILIMVFIS